MDRYLCLLVLVLACPACNRLFMFRQGTRANGGVTPDFSRFRPGEGGAIAVLPPTNETPDMDLPAIVRTRLVRGLVKRGLEVQDVDECDAKLHGRGLSQAGQLNSLDPRALGQLLGVQFLLYSNIEELCRAIVGRRGYCLKFWSSYRLVHAPTDSLLWVAASDATEPVLTVTTGGLARRGVDKALGTLFGGRLLTESELAEPLHRERLVKVIWLLFGGGQLGHAGFYGGTAFRIGKGQYHVETGVSFGRSDKSTSSVLDLGVCKWLPVNTFIASYFSAGASLGSREVIDPAGDRKETVVLPYLTAGIGFNLMGAYSSLEARLSETAGGLGIGFTMGYIF